MFVVQKTYRGEPLMTGGAIAGATGWRGPEMSARIATPTMENAPEATRPILQNLKQMVGMVPNLFATIGHSSNALAALLHWDSTIAKGTLSKREIEQINLVVSEQNGCGYCTSAHTAIGRKVGLSEQETIDARRGIGSNEREQAVLDFARKIVRTGGSGTGAELERARAAGITDAELIDIIAVVMSKSFTNAVAIVAQTEIDWPRAKRIAGY